MQFICPAKNKTQGVNNNDISKIYAVPAGVETILKISCYDCHTNNIVYPWYAQVQPAGWWLDEHIKDGKKNLNFSEFKTYTIRRRYRKLEEINELVKYGEMPLDEYLWIHKNAKLNEQQKLVLANWVTTIRDTIKANYPADSLVKKNNS